LKKNAPGQVPALEWIDSETKQTRFIPESLIVCDYLDETHDDKYRLHSTDAYVKTQQRVLIDRFSNVSCMLLVFN
jgi:glutathione S-transferase